MKLRPYHTQRELAEEFSMNYRTVVSRLKEVRALKDRYGARAIIDDGNIVLVYVPAFVDYMSNRRMLMDKNLSKYVEPYRPDEIIRELGMHSWDYILTEYKEEKKPVQSNDKESIKQAVREILMEGIGNEKRAV